jgi:hypothetical protein
MGHGRQAETETNQRRKSCHLFVYKLGTHLREELFFVNPMLTFSEIMRDRKGLKGLVRALNVWGFSLSS